MKPTVCLVHENPGLLRSSLVEAYRILCAFASLGIGGTKRTRDEWIPIPQSEQPIAEDALEDVMNFMFEAEGRSQH